MEKEFDPLKKMREWILEEQIASETELNEIEREALEHIKQIQQRAWINYQEPIRKEKDEFLDIVQGRGCNCKTDKFNKVESLATDLKRIANPIRKDIVSSGKRILR